MVDTPSEAPAAAAPAPAATPSPSPAGGVMPSEAAAGATETGNDFDNFDSDYDEIDVGSEESPSPQPEGEQPAAAPAAKEAPAPTAAPPAQAAAASPAQPAPPAEGAAPPPSAVDALLQGLESNAPALRDWLAANAYALTKEEAEAFELDAVGQVPKLMAKVAVANMKSTMAMIKNVVPQLIQAEVDRLTSSKDRQKEAIDEFYSTNPHLNAKDHGKLVTKWANAFRQANPKASRKEAIEYVGRAVSYETGVMPGTKPAAKAAPFAPARPGARLPQAPPPAPHPFEMLGMDLDE